MLQTSLTTQLCHASNGRCTESLEAQQSPAGQAGSGRMVEDCPINPRLCSSIQEALVQLDDVMEDQ
jgi:hypothetical protein